MAVGNEDVTFMNFMPRAAKKLAQPGVMSTFRNLMSAQDGTDNTIGWQVERNARECGDRPAVKFEGREISWADFNAQANRYAHVLQQRGVEHGDKVAINMPNCPELLMAVVGTCKLGAIAGMINTGQKDKVLAHSIGLVEPKVAIVAEEQKPLMDTLDAEVAATLAGKCLMVCDGDPAAGYESLEALAAEASDANPVSSKPVDLRDPCFYIFTSGTTGMPKASITTHGRWYRGSAGMGGLALTMSRDDIFYVCLPLYHTNALTIAFGSVVNTGGCIALARKFSASRFFDDCREYGATCFCYIGELLRYLLNQPPRDNDRDHKVYKIIGNGLRPDVWDQFKTRFGIDRIHEFYGSSEAPLGWVNYFNYDKTCGCAPGDWEIVDYDIDADEVRRDANGKLIPLKKGDVGLLIIGVSDKTPFDGYTDKAAGEKKLFRDVLKPGDCYFNSGDLVRKQGFGHIQFVDRVGDTFRWQGENVATTEVESVLVVHPQVEDAAVYGVEVPGRDGRCGMASVTPKAGVDLDLADLAKCLQKALPKYAVPRFMRIRVAQDMTGTFKYQKTQLKKEAYDPELVGEALYYLAPGSQEAVPIDAALKAAIDSGDRKL